MRSKTLREPAGIAATSRPCRPWRHSRDRTGARAALVRLFRLMPNIQKVFADGGYAGKLID